MSSNIIRSGLYEGRRARREQIGLEAELHVCEQLCKIFGKNKIQHGLPGYSGTNGEPDILVQAPYGLLFIEVKSMRPFYRTYKTLKTKTHRVGYWKQGNFKLNKEAWAHLKSLSLDRRAQIFIIVDLRFKREDRRVDLLFTEKQIDEFMSRSTAKGWLHISLPEVFQHGLVISYETDPFETEIIEKDFKQQPL